MLSERRLFVLLALMAILALFIGGQFRGLFGMLVAVSAAAVIKVFVDSIVSSCRNTYYYRREA
jgi:predicted PurR-regulated permease PerM